MRRGGDIGAVFRELCDAIVVTSMRGVVVLWKTLQEIIRDIGLKETRANQVTPHWTGARNESDMDSDSRNGSCHGECDQHHEGIE